MNKKFLPVLLFLTFSIGCSYNSSDLDCTTVIGARFSSSGGQMQALIQNKCSGNDCHSTGGKGAVQWAIGPYQDIKSHFDQMYEAVKSGAMPKAGATPLTEEELDRFECWHQAGYPE